MLDVTETAAAVVAVVILGAAVLGKLRHRDWLDRMNLPDDLRAVVDPVHRGLPFLELLLVLLIVVPATRQRGLLAAGVLFGCFGVGILVLKRVAPSARCACFGRPQARPLATVHALSNLATGGLLLAGAAAATRSNQLWDIALGVGWGCALLLVYSVVTDAQILLDDQGRP